jgi:hypothetical protein
MRVASPPCAFIFSTISVPGFDCTICCSNLPLSLVFLLFTFSVIPGSLVHYVNIICSNEIKGQQLPDLKKNPKDFGKNY